MPNPFLSSEEYDERAHKLYNEGDYDKALAVLREGLAIYPNSVELHIGVGYAYHAREEFAWAKRSFEEALVLDPEHEDALAGYAETILRFGRKDEAISTFRRTVELGYSDDVDLMLQIGRALFREGIIEESKTYFEIAVEMAPESGEAVACLGYAQHRLGADTDAIVTLNKALALDPEHVEARVYLGNIHYDRSEYEQALQNLERSTPEDHWDELGIWRLIELKKVLYKLPESDPELRPWELRIDELTSETDDIDEMLAEIEAKAYEAFEGEHSAARGQLELFGALLNTLSAAHRELGLSTDDAHNAAHRIIFGDHAFEGTWEEIVQQMRDKQNSHVSIEQFMKTEARRAYGLTGVEIPDNDAESFIKASASAGILKIDR